MYALLLAVLLLGRHSTSTMPTPAEIQRLARDCAANVYGARPPSPHYVEAVTSLLCGTAAVESNLEYRRQHGFGWESMRGAWGLWQTEALPLLDNLAYLARRKDVADAAARWLYGVDDATLEPLFSMNQATLVRTIAGWDRLACLMARVHYLRVPAPIPNTQAGRAEYWKRWYNTHLGAGTTDGYLERYRQHFGGTQ